MQKNIIICVKDIDRINHFIIWKDIIKEFQGGFGVFLIFSKVLVGFGLCVFFNLIFR